MNFRKITGTYEWWYSTTMISEPMTYFSVFQIFPIKKNFKEKICMEIRKIVKYVMDFQKITGTYDDF